MRMGLEVEIPFVHERETRAISGSVVHDDGSIRHTNYAYDGVSVLPLYVHGQWQYPLGVSGVDRFGAEIVSSPMMYPELRQYAERIAKMYRHLPTTPTAGVHIHVDVGDKPWRHVQRLVALFARLEAVLFRLSALGETHRGIVNALDAHGAMTQRDHNYARPLTNSIGWLTGRSSRPRALIDLPALLKAKTASSFVAAWGRLDTTWRSTPRYCPHRLHALNIVPLQSHGTVEWRLFNARYAYLPMIVDIVHAFHERVDDIDIQALPNMPLGSTPDITAHDVSELLGIDIRGIWGKRWLPPCRTDALLSHYRYEAGTFGDQQTITSTQGAVDSGDDTFTWRKERTAEDIRRQRDLILQRMRDEASSGDDDDDDDDEDTTESSSFPGDDLSFLYDDFAVPVAQLSSGTSTTNLYIDTTTQPEAVPTRSFAWSIGTSRSSSEWFITEGTPSNVQD